MSGRQSADEASSAFQVFHMDRAAVSLDDRFAMTGPRPLPGKLYALQAL